jgi:PAS domain S-box-containing protein
MDYINKSSLYLSNEYNAIFDNAGVVLMLIDKEGKILNINKSGLRMVGKNKEDILNVLAGEVFNCINSWAEGKPVCGIGKNCVHCAVRNIFSNTFLTKKTNYKIEGTLDVVLNNNTTKLNILVTAAIINSNNNECVLLTIDDITGQKKLEHKLKISEERLKKAQQIAKLGHWELDIVNNKLMWSDEIYRIFDIKPQEFDATYEAFLNNIHPEDRDKVNEAYTSSLKNKTDYEIEHRLLLKSGKIKYVLEKCHTEYNELGNPILSIGTVSDITELKEKENKLQEAIETKDKFLSIIAHDLRSPFNTLLGFSEVLMKEHKEYGVEEREKMIKLVNLSANMAFNLLENLLSWSLSQFGKIKFSPEKLNLKTLLLGILDGLQQLAYRKNIQILETFFVEAVCFADKNMIATIFRNLISNAIKFTNRNGTITIAAEKENGFLEISVTDTGVGIPKERIDDIFCINKNISTKGTVGEKGSGLGLILCKDFVERHGGKIRVKSEIGKGTSFIFTIPLLKDELR